MSAIAKVLLAAGHDISGSDRNFDMGKNLALCADFQKKGVGIFPQDGSGVDNSIDIFVVSSAIEDSIPDVIKAKEEGLTIKTRAQVLADILSSYNGIAIGGTSGKTTVTAMTGHILNVAGLSPTVINGGIMLNEGSNVILGSGGFGVIEADESDGSIEFYRPSVAVVNNITLDHKPLAELRKLFKDFVSTASVGAVLNADCPEAFNLKGYNSNVLTFSLTGKEDADIKAANICLIEGGSSFTIDDTRFELKVIGKHNIANALAAIGVADMLGIPREVSAKALYSYKGVHRRLETVGTGNDITVIDDFAHNPAKIEASLSALKESLGRLWVIYQPHGFAPTRLMKEGLINAFASYLDKNDILLFSEIFYAGGSVSRDISSADIAGPLLEKGLNAQVVPSRADMLGMIMAKARAGDRIVVMGARDDTLSDFARLILQAVESPNKGKDTGNETMED